MALTLLRVTCSFKFKMNLKLSTKWFFHNKYFLLLHLYSVMTCSRLYWYPAASPKNVFTSCLYLHNVSIHRNLLNLYDVCVYMYMCLCVYIYMNYTVNHTYAFGIANVTHAEICFFFFFFNATNPQVNLNNTKM